MLNYKNISINAAFVIVIALAVCLVSCSKHDDRVDFYQGLPVELVTILVEGDGSQLGLYMREKGLESTMDANRHFSNLVYDMSQQEYLRHADSLDVLQKRLCIVLAEEFNYDFFLNDLEFLKTFPPAKRQEIMIARATMWVIDNKTDMTHEAKVDSITGYYNMMVGNDDTHGEGIAKMALFKIFEASGDRNRAKQYLIGASNDFSEIGFHEPACQALGGLGAVYGNEGVFDSMEMCFQRARELAVNYQLSNQISRISYFYAGYYSRRGRLALANDLINEAIELCRTYKGGYYEIRYLYHAMEFYSKYSCWETVERLLARAKILGKVHDDLRYSRHFDIWIKVIEARWLMARGDVKKANALNWEIEHSTDETSIEANRFTHPYYWASGLLDNGLVENAIKVIDRGLNRPGHKFTHREESRILALKARAEFERGNIEEVRMALERFDLVSPRIKNPLLLDGITCDVLRARVALSDGDSTEAFTCLEDGLGHLRSFVGLMDISVQGYLWINECFELRKLMHELTSHDLKLQYGAELFWRNIALDMGTRLVDPATSFELAMAASASHGTTARSVDENTLKDHFNWLAEAAMMSMRELEAVHCMYVMDDNNITRFTVSPKGVRRNKIQCSRGEMHALVSETHRHMEGVKEAGGIEDSIDVQRNLTKLGRHLLPDDLRNNAYPGNPRTLLITTDDFLGRVPFEAFNISSDGGYVSLLEHFDVAYLRHFENKYSTHRSDNPGIIIVNSGSARLSRSKCLFANKLKCIKAEGRAVAALDSSAVLLQGSEVTKQEIRKRWEDASYLYIATHIIRDPEIPFLVLVPLVLPEGDLSPESGFLDFTDIRSADFSRCELVVLSGCSSGVPSVAARNIGPSLGDAFLDAGAAAVITTFWDVKDEGALKLMTLYTLELESDNRSHIRALCKARRKLFREDPEPLNSFDWASYAINIGRLSEM